MAQIARTSVNTLAGLLRSRQGVNAKLCDIAVAENVELPEIEENQVVTGPAINESKAPNPSLHHPTLYVYCDRVSNLQREKFTRFSGRARLILEVHVSESRLENLDRSMHIYTEAVTEVLEENYGDWGQGISFGGKYEIQYQPPRLGGLNYEQTAKILVEVDVSQPHLGKK